MSNTAGKVLEKTVNSSRRDEDDVMPSIEALAQELEISPPCIELIIVSVGPGGFTGLRCGVAIAKMIALVSGCAVVPVKTAVSVVNHARVGQGQFLVVSGVKQESFWLSRVHNEGGRWVCESSSSNTSEIEPLLTGTTAVFGDLYVPESLAALCAVRKVKILDATTSAKSLLFLGLEQYLNSKECAIHPRELLPLYPREPEAVRVWKNLKKSGRS